MRSIKKKISTIQNRIQTRSKQDQYTKHTEYKETEEHKKKLKKKKKTNEGISRAEVDEDIKTKSERKIKLERR